MALTDPIDHADQPSEAAKPATDPPAADHARTSPPAAGSPLAGPDPTLVLEALRAHWGELAALDQKLLLLRFFGNMTPDEIGGELCVPPFQAAELVQRALGTLTVLIEPACGG